MGDLRAIVMVAALIVGIMVMKVAPIIGVPIIGVAIWAAQKADTERLIGWIAVAGIACFIGWAALAAFK